MNFKDIFDRTVPLDSLIKEEIEESILKEGKITKKNLNIFYKIDLDLIKAKDSEKEENIEQPAATDQQPVNSQPEQPQQPETTEVPPASAQPSETEPSPEENSKPDLNYALSSVVTEDVIINDKNKIIRRSERRIKLDKNKVNEIQSIEDIISVLTKNKKDGVKIFDDFTSEIVTLCINQKFDELKNKLDKKSKIYFEIYYGKSKEDSIGLRINKRANSDTMTSTILLDNEIVSTKFDINKINQKIIEYRNYEVKKS